MEVFLRRSVVCALGVAMIAAACSAPSGSPSPSAPTPEATTNPTSVATTVAASPSTVTVNPTSPLPSTTTTSSVDPATTVARPHTPDDAPPGPDPPEPQQTVPRVVTAADPLRVWVIGDSLAGPLGYAMADRSRDDERVVVTVDHTGGSGLADPGYFDWPNAIDELVGAVEPDAVVVHIGANDAQGMTTPTGWVGFGTPAWSTGYAAVTGAVMDRLLQVADRVVWVGPPVMGGDRFTEKIAVIAALAAAEAQARPAVVFIDAGAVFAAPDGGYTALLPGADGVPVRVRQDDGVHYTAEGAALLAAVVLERVHFEWRLWD